LEKDFLYFMRSNDIIDFKKVFQFLALNIWNIIKIWKITDVLSVSKYKVNWFLKFLLDSYLIKEIPPFYTDKSKEYNSQDEFIFLDLGLLNYIKWTFDVNLSDWKIIENFVAIQLLDKNRENNLYYYNKKNGSEIDFILEKLDQKIIPIEVKSANKFIKPKTFFTFEEVYFDKIDKFITTTRNEENKDVIKNKEILFTPNYLIEKII
jgi:predicted AAA+ superfamily ATPase